MKIPKVAKNVGRVAAPLAAAAIAKEVQKLIVKKGGKLPMGAAFGPVLAAVVANELQKQILKTVDGKKGNSIGSSKPKPETP